MRGLFFFLIATLLLVELLVVLYPSVQGVPIGPGYLVFHSFVEGVVALIGILLGAQFFRVFWKTAQIHFLILGSGFFVAAAFDALHLLSYGGMPTTVIFPSANTSEFFWLVARGVLGAALLFAALVHFRIIRRAAWMRAGFCITALCIGGIYLFAFLFGTDIPALVHITGATELKKINELIVGGIYLIAGLVYGVRYWKSGDILYLLLMFFALTVFAEINQALSLGPTFFSNWLSHVYTALAYAVLLCVASGLMKRDRV